MSIKYDHNNMVESTKDSDTKTEVSDLINNLNLLSISKISAKDIEFDISQIEKFTEGWISFNEEKRKNLILKNLERKISLDLFENEVNTDNLTFNELKSKLIERYGKPAISMPEYFIQKQGQNEDIVSFIRRMEKDGKKLKLTSKVRFEVIRQGITRFQKAMLIIMVNKKKISDELIEEFRQREALEIKFSRENKPLLQNFTKENKPYSKEKIYKCFSCGKPGHIAKNCRRGKPINTVNDVEHEIAEENKDTYAYFSSFKIKPIFDTGSEENYITLDLVNKLGLKTLKKNVFEKRYTCLGQPFYVKEYLLIEFVHKEKKWKEIFNVLPGRKGITVLLGRKWLKKASTNNLDNKEKEKFEDLKLKLFTRNPKGIEMNYECSIDCSEKDRVSEGTALIPQALESKVFETAQNLLNCGYIQVSNSSWCNRIRPVEKEDGTIRLTTNLIALNKKVPLEKYSLPKSEEILRNLNGFKYFSKIDLKDGFFHIPLKKEDRHKTAFRIKNRLYEWTRMPQGFKNAPAVFQRLMDIILKEEIGKGCYVYVDDIIIFGRTEEDHDENLQIIMEKLISAGLQGNEKKCAFKQSKVEFLGHIISENEIRPLIETTNTIKNYPRPLNSDEVRRFLGLVNYYRKFIPKCADIIEPIAMLIRKNVNFIWGTEQEYAFNKIKEILNSKTFLIQPNYQNEFILETDASNTGLGAILAQEHKGDIRPIAYASRALTSTERNYSITEKEMLGALWAMEHFYYYLYGRQFILKTDHKALEAINTKGYLNSSRIERWQDRICRFNYKVEYQKGETIEHVDALSRQFMNQAVNEIKSDDSIQTIITRTHENLIHRGSKAVYEQLRKDGYNEISESEVARVLKDCKKCKMYNPIRSRATRVIEAFIPGEKVGFDIIELGKGNNIFVAIDYFTRKGFAIYSRMKTTEKVLTFLKEVHNQLSIKTLIADEGKENMSRSIKDWLLKEGIKHHTTTPYHHQSNGRVERFNRTIRESLNKLEIPGTLHMRIEKVIEKYNNTYHRSIGMSPNEAIVQDRWNEVKRNQYEARIKENNDFILKGSWSKLQIGDEVLIKDELRKSKKGPRFKTEATVKEILDFDTYKLQKENGKVYKRHISQLKRL